MMFEGLKILELASVLAGPSVGQFFAELGATVIKVENAKSSGDVTRTWKAEGENTDDRSAYFCSVNWGKKSIAINLETQEGREIIYNLVKISDIVIASYKPGDAEKIGVDYKTLRKLNSNLLYGQITGYGSDDQRVGYDAVIQAESGFMSMNGEPGGNSLKMPVALVDVLAAHHLKEGLLLGMIEKSRTGQGGFVEVSLIQAAISSLCNQAANWLVSGIIPHKQGSAHPNIAPYGDIFITSEGKEILLAIGNDKQFRGLCSLLGISQVADDKRYISNAVRVVNRNSLRSLLQERFLNTEGNAILAQLKEARIPAGSIQDMQQVFETPQAKEIVMSSSNRIGVRNYIGSPRPILGSHFLPPPHFGEHTVDILSNSLKMDDNTIEKLISIGSVR
jgi:crotonobetainyl-CoA:carnitine CoA-transferase CaiB-like acyl-CoA transferase